MSERVLAVDFGTTATVAAASTGGPSGRVDVVSLGGETQLPSAVFRDDTGRLLVGPQIPEGAPAASIERTPKRWLGHRAVPVGAGMVDDRDLAACVLGFVAEEARRAANGESYRRVVLTHPATWQTARQRRLAEAAGRTELTGPEMMAEPVAAARALLARGAFLDLADDALVAVYDLGGGTLDLSLLRYRDGGFALVGEPSGHEEMGGEYLDELLLERVMGVLADEERELLRHPDLAASDLDDAPAARWAAARATLGHRVRRAKERLKYTATAEIVFPDVLASRRGYTITDTELRELAAPMIGRTAELLDRRLLERNGHAAADLAAICLVGGGAKLAVVPAVLAERFGCPIAAHGELATLVATGAAMAPAAAAGSPAGTTSRPRTTPAGSTGPAHPQDGVADEPARPRSLQQELAERAATRGADVIRLRAELEERLKDGSFGIVELLDRARGNDLIGGMTVSSVVGALPGSGPSRAREVATRVGIPEALCLRDLSEEQRGALIGECGVVSSLRAAAHHTPGAATQSAAEVVIDVLRRTLGGPQPEAGIHIAGPGGSIAVHRRHRSGVDYFPGPDGLVVGLVDMTIRRTRKEAFIFTSTHVSCATGWEGFRWSCSHATLPTNVRLLPKSQVEVGHRRMNLLGPFGSAAGRDSFVLLLARLREAFAT